MVTLQTTSMQMSQMFRFVSYMLVTLTDVILTVIGQNHL
jgi:hypothetical protein